MQYKLVSCRTCRFAKFPWLPEDDEFQYGVCRRHAPVGVQRTCSATGSVTVKAEWPQIDTDNGCGDYEVMPATNEPAS